MKTPILGFFLFTSICNNLYCDATVDVKANISLSYPSTVYIRCTFPREAQLVRSVTFLRRIYRDSIFTRIGFINCTERWTFIPESTAISRVVMDGSVIFSISRANCLDTGIYMCHTAFSRTSYIFINEKLIETANLDMMPRSMFLTTQPERLLFDTMGPSIKLNVFCSIYTTVSITENDWVWETRPSSDTPWTTLPSSSWRISKVPAIGQRCFIPWRTVFTVEVSKADLNREYRCFVSFSEGQPQFNSSDAIFVVNDDSTPKSGRMTLYAVVIATFVSGILVLGIILISRSHSNIATTMCSASRHFHRRRHLCNNCSQQQAASNVGGRPELSPVIPGDSPQGLATSGAGDGAGPNNIFSPRPCARTSRPTFRSTSSHKSKNVEDVSFPESIFDEEDSPGAEEDSHYEVYLNMVSDRGATKTKDASSSAEGSSLPRHNPFMPYTVPVTIRSSPVKKTEKYASVSVAVSGKAAESLPGSAAAEVQQVKQENLQSPPQTSPTSHGRSSKSPSEVTEKVKCSAITMISANERQTTVPLAFWATPSLSRSESSLTDRCDFEPKSASSLISAAQCSEGFATQLADDKKGTKTKNLKPTRAFGEVEDSPLTSSACSVLDGASTSSEQVSSDVQTNSDQESQLPKVSGTFSDEADNPLAVKATYSMPKSSRDFKRKSKSKKDSTAVVSKPTTSYSKKKNSN